MDGFAEGRGGVYVLFVDVLILNLCSLDFRKKGLDLGASNSVVVRTTGWDYPDPLWRV